MKTHCPPNSKVVFWRTSLLEQRISRLSYRIFRDKMQELNFNENIFGIAPQDYIVVSVEYKERQLIEDIYMSDIE